MTQLQLIQQISAPGVSIGAKKLGNQLRKENFSLLDLVDLTFHPDQPTAQKASKLLEYVLFKFPDSYYSDIDYLVKQAANVASPAIIKYYAKILMQITSPEMPRLMRNKVREIDFENTIELCFLWMADAKMLTGVRASAAETLFNLRHSYPWIAEALSNQLELIMHNANPMLAAKGNYILSFLHCED